MKIQEQDIYHGAALTQIVEHPSFKALNRADDKYGHYLVNSDRRVFIKYRTNDTTPWIFTIQPTEVKAMKTDLKRGAKVFLCLVCGHKTVCAIDFHQIERLIEIDNDTSQFIRIEVPKGGSMWLQGSKGKLDRTITHKSFPDKIFESSETMGA